MRSPLSKLFAIAALFFIATGAYAALGTVDLGWDENPEQDVMGYKSTLVPLAAFTANLTMCPRPRRRYRTWRWEFGITSPSRLTICRVWRAITPRKFPQSSHRRPARLQLRHQRRLPHPLLPPPTNGDSDTHSYRHPDSNSYRDPDSNSHRHPDSNKIHSNSDANGDSHRNSNPNCNSNTASGDCYSAHRPNCFRRAICHL